MKNVVLVIVLISFLFSCKKEKPYNPDQHIGYAHWYQTKSNSSDTLFSVYIPNSFTPNYDGINDNFLTLGYYNTLGFSLKVFGRNGNVIFNTNDRYMRWNGKVNNGDLVPNGSYIYKLNLNNAVGNSYEYQGSVTLFK